MTELGPFAKLLVDSARDGLGPDELAVARMRARVAAVAGGAVVVAATEAAATTTRCGHGRGRDDREEVSSPPS